MGICPHNGVKSFRNRAAEDASGLNGEATPTVEHSREGPACDRKAGSHGVPAIRRGGMNDVNYSCTSNLINRARARHLEVQLS